MSRRLLDAARRSEFLVVVRFGIVGVLATALHLLVVWVLLSQTAMRPLQANTLAFLTAFGVTFAGNYLWTFRSPGRPRRAMLRSAVISIGAFSINTVLLAFLVRGNWLSPMASTVLSASIVPVLSFTASRFWGFEKS